MVIVHFPETGPARGCDEFACETGMGDWRAYEDALVSGKVRSIGVSNYCQKCLDCILANGTVKPQLNQFQWHVGMGPDPIGLVSYTTDHGVLVQSYTTLAAGMILNPDMYANASDLAAIGAAHNVSAAQVALKWVLQKGHAVVTKADKAEYLEQDMDVYSWNLTAAELAELDALPCNRTGWPMGYCDPSFTCPARTFAPTPRRA